MVILQPFRSEGIQTQYLDVLIKNTIFLFHLGLG